MRRLDRGLLEKDPLVRCYCMLLMVKFVFGDRIRVNLILKKLHFKMVEDQ